MPADVEATTRAAEEFFLESLSAFEIVRRGYNEAREAARLEQRNTAILRQLSSFLADASLAVGAHESLAEMLQLVAEHAREIVDADACTVKLGTFRGDLSRRGRRPVMHLLVRMTSLDGRELGSVEVARGEGDFSDTRRGDPRPPGADGVRRDRARAALRRLSRRRAALRRAGAASPSA